jgi:hypothetical protein
MMRDDESYFLLGSLSRSSVVSEKKIVTPVNANCRFGVDYLLSTATIRVVSLRRLRRPRSANGNGSCVCDHTFLTFSRNFNEILTVRRN